MEGLRIRETRCELEHYDYARTLCYRRGMMNMVMRFERMPAEERQLLNRNLGTLFEGKTFGQVDEIILNLIRQTGGA